MFPSKGWNNPAWKTQVNNRLHRSPVARFVILFSSVALPIRVIPLYHTDPSPVTAKGVITTGWCLDAANDMRG